MYKPNKDAIDYLNYHIMPTLIKKFPNLKLILTGGGFNKKFPWVVNKGIVTKIKLYMSIYYLQNVCVYH